MLANGDRAVGRTLDAGEGDGAPGGRAVPARADRPEPHAAYYIDAEGVVVRAYSDPANGDPMAHARNRARRRATLRAGDAFVLLLLCEAFALIVFGLLAWFWR